MPDLKRKSTDSLSRQLQRILKEQIEIFYQDVSPDRHRRISHSDVSKYTCGFSTKEVNKIRNYWIFYLTQGFPINFHPQILDRLD